MKKIPTSLKILLIFCLLINIIFFTFFEKMVNEGFIVVFLPFILMFMINFTIIVELRKLFSNKNKDVIKKYGSNENYSLILNQIKNTSGFENNIVVITDKYLAIKTYESNDFENILELDNIIGVYKEEDKIDVSEHYLNIIIIDNKKEEYILTYDFIKDQKIIKNTFEILKEKCKNAKVGEKIDVEYSLNFVLSKH